MIIYKGQGIQSHPSIGEFNTRLLQALSREKFFRPNGTEPQDSTPISLIQSSKYIIEQVNTRSVFICTPHLLFEELCDTLWEIAKSESEIKISPYVLLQKAYNSHRYRELDIDWESKYWTIDFQRFYSHLKEESFFYFDDLENQYYFNLFREIKNRGSVTEFEGGILHALTKHFKHFSKFHPTSNDHNEYQYNSLMWNIINCSINGNIIDSKPTKYRDNYILSKEIEINTNQRIRVGLYWENTKQLYFLNTLFIKTI